MTVTAVVRKAGPFLGNGVTTTFPFTFKVFAKTDLTLTRTNALGVDTVLTLDSNYSVTLNADQDNNPGGTITYPLSGTLLATGETLTGLGNVDTTQGLDITNAGRFLPQVVEDAFDRIFMIAQQLLEKMNRAVVVPAGESSIEPLPALAVRASKFSAFDASGNPIASSGTGADAGLRTDLAASTGSSLLGWQQAGTGGLLRLIRDKLRERWSLEDHGAVGDGVTDDRAAIQSALNALSLAGGGVIKGVAGKTYLVKAKVAATKNIGSVSRSYGLEIPNNVLIDLQSATIKAFAATDYVPISNPTSGAGTNNNSNLGIINGTLDLNQHSAAGAAQGITFYGVRRLHLDQLEIKNGYNIALDLEACDQFDIGTLVFRSCTGAAFYIGGATASGGAACDKGHVGSVTCYDTADHPINTGLPGNPMLLNATNTQLGEIKAFNCDAGIKVTAGNNLQIGRTLFIGNTKQNSGLKIQGTSETQMVERVTVGEVISKDCGGVGLFLVWCRGVQIGSYIGKGNVTLGLDVDASVSGDDIKIGNFESIDCGRIALELTTSSGNNFNRSPNCTVDNLRVLNPWSVASSGTAAGVAVTNGTLRVGLLDMEDNRPTPKMVRYFALANRELCITVDEFRARGASGNPDFLLTGARASWIGRPDIAALNFSGGTLTLSSAAVGTGVTATASLAVFAATDVGALLFSQDGRGVAEITAFTSSTVVTVANRVAWAAGAAIADDAWYLDRGNGGAGTFAPNAAATTTIITDAGFLNTASRGQPVIEVIPTNAAARTLGKPVFDVVGSGTVTFKHAAAAGTETYSYRVLGWTS